MKARDLMTSDPLAVIPTDTVTRAAELMRNIGIGALPIVQDLDSRLLIGIITDRDLVVRCMADGHGPACTVWCHMTEAPLQTVEPEDDESLVVEKMESAQVRRIPVVNADNKLLGIIAQADVARKLGPTEPQIVDEVLEKISAPVAASA
jgi:CBS domain-containing protein